MRLRVAAAVRI